MCGFVGLVAPEHVKLDLGQLCRATARIRHRGPDDEGYLVADTRHSSPTSFAGDDSDPRLGLPHIRDAIGAHSANLALGFRRLSIIDLSERGHQPMRSADASLWIVFNGEVYNHPELRTQLEALGHVFRSRSDTEVVLAAYQQWGVACLERMVGMWGLLIWDVKRREVVLARDPFGIKPLYYAHAGQCLAVGSEIKSLLELPELAREPNPDAVWQFLQRGLGDYGEDTIYRHVRQLPGGHFARVAIDAPSVTPVPYVSYDIEHNRDITFSEATRRVRELFLHNIQLHLRSDVPFGSALSGGIDSSSIVACIRRLEAQAVVHAFSFISDEPATDESRWIDLVSRRCDAKLHLVRARPEELLDDLDDLVRIQDMPFGSTSVYAQYRVFRSAHEAGIKVMLDGQGADEAFAGYVHYARRRLTSLVKQRAWLRALWFSRTAARLYPQSGWAGHLGNALTQGEVLPRRVVSLARRLQPKVVDPGAAAVRVDWFRPRLSPKPPGERDPVTLLPTLKRALALDSLPALLRYEDRNSMAFSIESRVPFLTWELVSFALSLPEEFLIDDHGVTKSVFRAAMRGITPDAILDRKDKIGFATPERTWLRDLRPWVESVLASDAAVGIPALDPGGVRFAWEEMLAGRAKFDWRFWRWINLIRWTELNAVDWS